MKNAAQTQTDLTTIRAMATALKVSDADVEKALGTAAPLETLVDLIEGKKAGQLCVSKAPCLEPCKPRENPLPTPTGHACMGRFQAPAAPAGRDPLVIKLENIKPGAELYMIRRAGDEVFDFDTAIKLPADTEKFVQAGEGGAAGSYNIVFDDAWCADNGIAPGHVLEIRQRTDDGKRASDGLVIPISGTGFPCVAAHVHGRRRQAANAIHLPPGDRIGNVQVQQLFVHEPDTTPPSVDPCKIGHELENGKLTIRGVAEPFAKVAIENYTSGELSPVTTVDPDGTFSACIDAGKDDGFVLHMLDHTSSFEDNLRPSKQTHERILTGIAGTCEPLVLADNPRLGLDGPMEIRMARSHISGETLMFDRGVTPGSLIRVVNQSSEPVKEFRTVASQGGSFVLPADLHQDDIVQITVSTPFARTTSDASTKIRAEVCHGKKGCELSLLEEYDDGALVQSFKKGAIAKAKNVDDVKSAAPKEACMPFKVTDVQGAERGLNAVITSDRVPSGDGRQQPQASLELDHESRSIVMAVDYKRLGGYEKGGSMNGNAGNLVPPNQAHGLVGDWTLTVVDSKGNTLGTGQVEVKNETRTSTCSSYNGRGGILPVGSIPRGTVSRSQHTMFHVTSFEPCA